MGFVFIVALLPALAWYGLGVVWPWVRAACRGEPMPLISSWGLQFAVAPAILALIVGPDWGAVAFLLVPGILPATYMHFALAGPYGDIVVQQALAMGLGLLTGLATAIFLGARSLVRYIPIAAILTAAAVTLAVAEIQAGHRIVTRAEELGARCLSRQSFLASVRQSSSWRHHHAEALVDGTWEIWSYRADDFQPTPSGVWLDPGQHECEDRAAWEREGGRP